ncbi:general stress protein [Isosphaeraceae bacterium EP7]
MQTVVGMFESRTAAEAAIQRLRDAGISTESIGVAARDVQVSESLTDDTGANDLSAEGATAGVVSGAGVGALVGLALVGTNLILPGLGPVLIGGPLAAALTGAGIGAASGGLIGGLVGVGLPEDEATHYHTGLEAGHIVVSATVPDLQAANVRKIFDEEGSTRTYAP